MDRRTKFFLVLIVLQIVTLILYADNLRRFKHEQNLRDARATIALVDIKIHIERGDLSEADLQVLRENWRAAEYEQVMPLSALENK